jgi:IPT/TIG domain-containing protein
VLVGLALVVVLMAGLVIVYSILQLADSNQPLALPEGSVRALIAFSLVLVFVCLAAFLYTNMNGSELTADGKVSRITEQQLTELKIQFVVAPEPAIDAGGNALKDPDGKPLYDATYYSKRGNGADDFGKQIFTTLATVFVSVISFYFGSSATASGVGAGAKAVQTGADGGPMVTPTIARLEPPNIPSGAQARALKIIGEGLGAVSRIKFDKVEVKPDSVGDKLVTVTVPADILSQAKTIKVSVVADKIESSAMDLNVSESPESG